MDKILEIMSEHPENEILTTGQSHTKKGSKNISMAVMVTEIAMQLLYACT